MEEIIGKLTELITNELAASQVNKDNESADTWRVRMRLMLKYYH